MTELQTEERRVFEPTGLAVTELEATDSLSRIAGRAVPYGARAQIGTPFGPYLESFERGAFGKLGKGLPLLLWHDSQAFPIGVSERWREDSTGLYGEWRMDTSERAQEAARLAKEGMLGYLSIRFAPAAGGTRAVVDDVTGLDHLVRTSARLLETSLVSTPAYADAEVSWVRSQFKPHSRRRPNRDYWMRELDKLRA